MLYCLHFISYWKQNQSIRGNGRKQYQDSPNPKKRANGIHSQPAKQQNPLVVRELNNAHAKAVCAFQNGARALSRHFELLYWQDFMHLCVCWSPTKKSLPTLDDRFGVLIQLCIWPLILLCGYLFICLFTIFSMNSYWSVVDLQSCVSSGEEVASVLRMSALDSVSV